MKFKFCWDTDCPDWLLAEIAKLSNLSSVKLRLLVSHVVDNILGGDIDHEKIAKWTGEQHKSTSALAYIGALRWIVISAAGAQVEADILDSELQQLGLPKEHTNSIIKVYTDKRTLVYNKLSENKGINCCGGNLLFNVDVKGLDVNGQIEPIAQLVFRDEASNAEEAKFCMTSEKLDVFLHELCEARQIMATLS